QQASVLLGVTCRSDERNRNDLLRPLLAGLARADGVSRLDLARVSRAQVAVQLEGILGRPPGTALISEVYQRGGGVPLLTEALVNSDGTISAGLPWSVRDLLLAAVKALPEPTQQALRIAAAGGARLSHLLLAAATGLDDAALAAAWRAAGAAGTALAYAQRLRMLEQVLELWDRVPEPARPAGLDHVGVLELAADAARWAGEPERGLALAEAAIAELDAVDDA